MDALDRRGSRQAGCGFPLGGSFDREFSGKRSGNHRRGKLSITADEAEGS